MGKIIRDTGSEIKKPIPVTGTVKLMKITRNIDDKVLRFQAYKNLIAAQNTNTNTAPISTDGFRRVGCVWYPGAPNGLYNRPVGYGSGRY